MGLLTRINQQSNNRKLVRLHPVLVLEESNANTETTKTMNSVTMKSVYGKMASKTVIMRANLLFHSQMKLLGPKLRASM